MSIKLSPKYGVNPCIPRCYWCGKEKNEIALLGRLKDDRKAPMSAVLNYEPCDECKALFMQGVMCFEVVDYSVSGNPPITKDNNGNPVYPNGAHIVIKEEAAQKMFSEDLHKGSMIALEQGIIASILEEANKNERCEG